MNIVATQYTLDNKALEIYVAGCNGNCKGCHNIELKDFNLGESSVEKTYEIIKKIETYDKMIDKIWVLGGEPLDQDLDSLEHMLILLRQLKTSIHELDIWLFTRYNLENMPQQIKNICDYIKCGPYIEELRTDDNIQYGIKLATSNQKIYKKGLDY